MASGGGGGGVSAHGSLTQLDYAAAGHTGFMSLATAQDVSGEKRFDPSTLVLDDSDSSHKITIATGNETADRILSLPVMGGDRTLALLEQAQLFTAKQQVRATATGERVFEILQSVAGGGGVVGWILVTDSGGVVQLRGGSLTLTGANDLTLQCANTDALKLTSGSVGDWSIVSRFKTPSTGTASSRYPAGVAPTTPVEGDRWNDSVQKCMVSYVGALKRYSSGLLASSAGRAAHSNSTSEAELLLNVSPGTVTLPANFWTVGKIVELEMLGIWSTAAVPGTVTVRGIFGLGPTTLCTSVAFTPTGSISAANWSARIVLRCVSVGAAGTIQCWGRFSYGSASADLASALTTYNTTAAQDIGFRWQWGTADAGNSVTPQIGTLKVAA